MAEINRRTGRPVTFGLAQSNAGPELYRTVLEFVDEEAATRRRAAPADHGARHRPALRLQHRTFFDRAPRVGARCSRSPLEARLAALDDPERRAELVADGRGATRRRLDWTGVYVLRPTATRVDYSADPTASLATHAERAGETIAEAFVRISRETRGRALFNFPFLNQRDGRGRGDARTTRASSIGLGRLRRARRA